jgi:hypothetical protein
VRKISVVEVRMRNSTNMPQLHKNGSTGVVNPFGYLFPALYLLAAMYAGSVDIADSLFRYL